jgi:hypothetical protein
MTHNNVRIARLLLATALVVTAMARATRAQVEVEPKPEENAAPPGRIVGREQDFDRWVFSLVRGTDAARVRLETILATRVEKIARRSALTEVQKKKLLLAGRGDIKRLFDRVDEMKANLKGDAEDQKKLMGFLEEMRLQRIDARGDVFGEGSIFAKALKTTLTSVQSAQYEKATRDGALARHRATIRWVVATFDTVLELNAVQHGQLETLLVEQTRPPRYFGEYDYYGVLFQASKLPETRFKSILSDRQWAKLSMHIAESKRLLPTLKAHGFVPDDDVAARNGSVDQPAAKLQNKRG